MGGVEPNTPAQILCFFGHETSQEMSNRDSDHLFAIVHYFTVSKWKHPIMGVPFCIKSNPKSPANYHVLSVFSIKEHAWMVPNFDDLSGSSWYWDRLVNSSSGDGSGFLPGDVASV